MQAGKLRHVGTIEQRSEIENPDGSIGWIYLPWAVNVRFEILDLSAREQFLAAQVQSNVTAKLRMRYRVGVTAKMRVAHVVESGSPGQVDYYDIEGVVRDPTHRRWLVLSCVRRGAEGFRSEDG